MTKSRTTPAVIEVHNPSCDDSDDEEPSDRCICCGEKMYGEYGVCLNCVQHDCDVSLDEPCSVNGAVDPLAYRVPSMEDCAETVLNLR